MLLDSELTVGLLGLLRNDCLHGKDGILLKYLKISYKYLKNLDIERGRFLNNFKIILSKFFLTLYT